MDAKRRAARHEIRCNAISKNAAQDAMHIFSAVNDGTDSPPSFRRALFSSSFSSLSSLAVDDESNSEVLQGNGLDLFLSLPPNLSVARHALKRATISKRASRDVMEFLQEAEAIDSFGWPFPCSRSSSSFSSASFSSFHTCAQDFIQEEEEDLYTHDHTEGNRILQESESNSPSSSDITLVEVDSNKIMNGSIAGAREPSQPSTSHKADDVNAPLPIEVPPLSLAELKEKTDNFGAESLVGKGLYGTVYLAVFDGEKQAAIRKLDEFNYSAPEAESTFLTHASKVSRLKHENFVEMLGYCAETNNHILAYEFATKGSLHDILHGRQGVENAQPGSLLNWKQRVRIAVDIAKGLEYLHEKAQPSIIHGRIKSSNVLLFEDYKAKIADFNLSYWSTFVDDSLPETLMPRHNFSFEYFPELLLTEGRSKKADIYNFGIVLLELLTGRKPVDTTMPKGQRVLVTWATPRLSMYKVRQCVDPRLKKEYSRWDVAKFAAVAALCLNDADRVKTDMSIVVQRLSTLL